MPQSFLDNPYVPLGLRNNNPGNLRPLSNGQKWLGEIEPDSVHGFSRFANVSWGLRAMITDLLGDIVKDGNSTIRKLITSYAPPSENDTQAYINRIVEFTGWNQDAKIPVTRAGIELLTHAMLRVELGNVEAERLNQGDYNEAFNTLGQTATNWLGTSPGGSIDLPLVLLAAGLAIFVLSKR